jgi:hypothetical protein
MQSLEESLEASRDARARLVVTDGVFSMDGNVAPLGAICDLVDKHNVFLFLSHLLLLLRLFLCIHLIFSLTPFRLPSLH